jgi:hypothetical protein
VSDKGEVELGVAGNEGGGRQIFSAADSVGVLEDLAVEGEGEGRGEREDNGGGIVSRRLRE